MNMPRLQKIRSSSVRTWNSFPVSRRHPKVILARGEANWHTAPGTVPQSPGAQVYHKKHLQVGEGGLGGQGAARCLVETLTLNIFGPRSVRLPVLLLSICDALEGPPQGA